MGVVEGFDLVHDLHAQGVRLGTMAVAAGLALFLHQHVDRFRKANQPVHGGKVFPLDEALSRQEVAFKKAALFHNEPDAFVHIPGHHIHHMRQHACLEVRNAVGTAGDVAQQQPGQGVTAASLQQTVVAAGDDVMVPQLPPEHGVIGEAGLCGMHGAADAFQQIAVRCLGADTHGQVGDGVLQFSFHLHDQAAGAGIHGADVRVAEGVQNGAVHIL